MHLRGVFGICLKNSLPLLCSTYATAFIHPQPPTIPNENEKLQLESLMKSLTYDQMIKQSTMDTVNGATRSLTITFMAIESTSKEYRSLLKKLINLTKETMEHEVSDSHQDLIVATRSEMQNKKQTVMRLIGFMDYVNKMANAASEMSYLSGMENLAITLNQRINDASNHLNRQISKNTAIENEYCLIQKEQIEKTIPQTSPIDENEKL